MPDAGLFVSHNMPPRLEIRHLADHGSRNSVFLCKHIASNNTRSIFGAYRANYVLSQFRVAVPFSPSHQIRMQARVMSIAHRCMMLVSSFFHVFGLSSSAKMIGIYASRIIARMKALRVCVGIMSDKKCDSWCEASLTVELELSVSKPIQSAEPNPAPTKRRVACRNRSILVCLGPKPSGVDVRNEGNWDHKKSRTTRTGAHAASSACAKNQKSQRVSVQTANKSDSSEYENGGKR